MLNSFFAFLPVLLLIYLMVRKKSMPSARALPLTALITYFVVLIVFKMPSSLVHANVLKGLLLAWTPILIIAGAIFLFKTMEATGGLEVLKAWLNTVTTNKVAQLMIVGWAFPFLIEGASGFGTPAAIAAPVLVGLGFPPVRVAVLTLIMNSVPVSFGAIGTPTWFGFSEINLTEAETLVISFKAALINSMAALIIPAIALMFMVKPKTVWQNILFILLSVLSTILPYLWVAGMNYEFPSLIGGATGLLMTVFLARKGIGLSHKAAELQSFIQKKPVTQKTDHDFTQIPSLKELLKASFPLWGTILLLIITRIPELGLKQLLSATTPSLELSLGTLGVFEISPSLVVSLKNIFGTEESWVHSILYVPSLIPFGLIGLITILMDKRNKSGGGHILHETVQQLKDPVRALLGALVFVSLMMMGGEQSAVNLIGKQMAGLTGDKWQYFASLLGALGSFFSGSATISNLTFGGIQDAIALQLNLDRTSILALQSAGAAMGNMICINNIVAVASILALGNQEGSILKKTVIAMIFYALVAGIAAVFI